MFAAIMPIYAVGAIAERGRLGPTLLVHLHNDRVLDMEPKWLGLQALRPRLCLSSGTVAFAVSLYLGKRRGYGTERLWSSARCSSAASVLFGVVTGTLANFATQLKFLLGVDDCLGIFALDAVGGVIGNMRIAFYDGVTKTDGGSVDHHYIQLAVQLADSVTGLAWSFVVTASDDAEILGIDDVEMGEFAYDYVGLEAELVPKEQRHDGTVGGNREPMHHPQAEVAGSNGSSVVRGCTKEAIW
ncbi:hypothetical protein AURDEDRAFT_176970 [Auricularia subglabra TFB-10046 SS5]|uniref:Ammonium transporter AmtB-like domain-containing protein n=1 Tax=Auricularia subglabra (strain TFB-10046 / SS5) TaxID=717982 RepID=J0CUH4_AURST|nr:hypothetical protein AURDEDRAFT_176970 [Auricularia subglabra TFB-10046 SS5]